MKILLVEDEKMLAEAVEQILKKNNYSVDLAYDGESGLDCALTGMYDVVVLDRMLPKKDGLAVLREMRAQKIATPVLLLTALGQPENKVEGLDCGADDYLAKPFHKGELLARLRALMRRQSALLPDGILDYGDLRLDPQSLRLTGGDHSARLTLKESQILELLIQRKGAAVSKEIMIEKLWGYDSEADDALVETHISLLRKKILSLNVCTHIVTVRGIGYSLAAD